MKRLLEWLSPAYTQPSTVRYMFPVVFFGIILALGASVLTSQNSSYIKLTSSTNQVTEGERFSVVVTAVAGVPINAVDIKIIYDETLISVVSVDTGRSVITLWTEDPVAKNGTISVSGGTYRRGFLGEHELITVEAVAKKTGKAQFFAKNPILLAGDGSGSAIKTTSTDESTVAILVLNTDSNESGELNGIVNLTIITDIDGDGVVTLRDISAFMAAWASRSTMHDFNNDGKMTFRDFSIILASYFFGN